MYKYVYYITHYWIKLGESQYSYIADNILVWHNEKKIPDIENPSVIIVWTTRY